MVMLANQPPRLVCIRLNVSFQFQVSSFKTRRRLPPFRIAIPAPHRGAGRIEHLISALSTECPAPRIHWVTGTWQPLPLRILEPFSRALLAVLLAFLGARVAADHSFRFELLAQFDVEQHERASNTELDGVSLSINSAASHSHHHIKRGR